MIRHMVHQSRALVAIASVAALACTSDGGSMGVAPPGGGGLEGESIRATADHPRLVFGAADLDGLRQKIDDPLVAGWYQHVVDSAIAGRDYSGGSEEERSRYARDMAFVGLIEEDGADTDAALAFLLAAGDNDLDWSGFGWRWGGVLLNYGLAYDWMQPFLSAEQDAAARARLEEISTPTFERYLLAPWSGSDKYHTNVRLRIAAGLGTIALALGDHGQAAARLQAILDDLFADAQEIPYFITSVVGRDGVYKEGASYQNDIAAAFAPFLLAYHHVTGVDWFSGGGGAFDDRLAQMYRSNVAMMMPSGWSPTANTGWIGNARTHEMVAWLLPFGSELMWYWDRAVGHPSWGAVPISIVFFDTNLLSERTEPPYLSTFLDNAAVFRSGWGPGDTWLLLDTSDEPSRSTHDQPSQTSIALYARGAYLLLDTGDGRNYGDDEHYWLRYSPISQNLVIVDEREGPVEWYSIGGDGATPSKIWRYEGEPEAVKDPVRKREAVVSPLMDYTSVAIDAYADLPEVGTIRSVHFPGRDYFVVTDEMIAAGSHTYDHVLHFGGVDDGERFAGELTIDGQELRFTTLNEDDDEVELKVLYVHPAVTVTEHTGPTNIRSGQTRDHTYTKARAQGSAVGFMTLLLPQSAEEEELSVSPHAVDGEHAAARLDGPDFLDLHALVLGEAPVTFQELTLNGRYGYARIRGDELAGLFLREGTRIEFDEILRIEATTPVTLALAPTSPSAFAGDIVGPAHTYELALAKVGLDQELEATLDGVPIPVRVDANGVPWFELHGSGHLEVGVADSPDEGEGDGVPAAPDPGGCGCQGTPSEGVLWLAALAPLALLRCRRQAHPRPGR